MDCMISHFGYLQHILGSIFPVAIERSQRMIDYKVDCLVLFPDFVMLIC